MVEPLICGRVTTLQCHLVRRSEPQYRKGHWLPQTEEVVHYGVVGQVFVLMPTVLGGIEPCPENAESMSRSVCDQSQNFVLLVLTGCIVDQRVLRELLPSSGVSVLSTHLLSSASKSCSGGFIPSLG